VGQALHSGIHKAGITHVSHWESHRLNFKVFSVVKLVGCLVRESLVFDVSLFALYDLILA
jgi:hypothetical protein